MNAAAAANREFYDALWSSSYLVAPERFNNLQTLCSAAGIGLMRLRIDLESIVEPEAESELADHQSPSIPATFHRIKG